MFFVFFGEAVSAERLYAGRRQRKRTRKRNFFIIVFSLSGKMAGNKKFGKISESGQYRKRQVNGKILRIFCYAEVRGDFPRKKLKQKGKLGFGNFPHTVFFYQKIGDFFCRKRTFFFDTAVHCLNFFFICHIGIGGGNFLE